MNKLARRSSKSKGSAIGLFRKRGRKIGPKMVMHEDCSAKTSPQYICQRCTNCCRWPGLVRLTNKDITSIAAYLKQSEFRFIQTYTRLRPHRDGLALQEREDGSCVFLNGRSCVIHQVKPAQCAGFPNEWRFPGWRSVCEAIEAEEAEP